MQPSHMASLTRALSHLQVDFVSNQACIDLIEAVPPKGLGLLAVLNDQCSFSDSSDASFMDALR